MVSLGGQQQPQSHQYVVDSKQSGKSQTKRASDWKKSNAMMPSQMSINDSKRHSTVQTSHQDPTSQLAHMYKNNKSGFTDSNANNVSASNGYLSQKASPMGRLSVERPVKQLHDTSNKTSSNKVVRYPYVSGKQGQSKSSLHPHQQNSRRTSQDNKDLQIAYSNQKMLGLNQNTNSNSASSLDKNYLQHQIDSGAGVVSGSGLQASTVHQTHHNHHRKDIVNSSNNFQRGISVEMQKGAIQSRRKHGSIDTYKQSTNNASNHHRDLSNHNTSSSGQIIRQGQGEIAQQRVSNPMVGSKGSSSIYTKSSGKPISQLPKVVRNSTNQSSVKTNISNGLSGVTRARQNSNSQMNSSTPSINNSALKNNQNVSGLSPTDEMRYQQNSSNYTNAIKQSALSRGSIKQSSQQALSGSNHMNLSLSQNSSRGLQKSHKDTSVEHLQERRIAYEASQGKMMNVDQTSGIRASNDQFLAQSQNKLPGTIVLAQQTKAGGGAQQSNINHAARHSRIRTNHSSLEKVSNSGANNNPGWNQSKAMGTEHHHPIQVRGPKRGAITQAQNSPRQILTQLKNQQPRLPESTSRVDIDHRYQQHNSASNTDKSLSNVKKAGGQLTLEEQRLAYKQAQKIKVNQQQMRKSSDAREEHLSTADFAAPQHEQRSDTKQQPQVVNQQIQDQNIRTPMTEVEYLAYVQQQHSAQSRYDNNDPNNSIEQYSRKLRTPNPILDGGTGSGGAQTIQNQTKQLLKEQQIMLERLGYQSQSNFQPNDINQSSGGQLTRQASSKIGSAAVDVTASGTSQQNLGVHHQKNQSAYQQQPGFHVFGLDQHNIKAQNQAYQKHQSSKSISSTKNHNQKVDSKKAILLQMQSNSNSVLNQKNQQHAESTKVLNLSHHVATGSVSLAKSANTKTSAQTNNTAFTMKAGNLPPNLQYSTNSQHSKQQVAAISGHKSSSTGLKLKKNASVAQSQPQNLIMHQNASKRSNSQEMILYPGNQHQSNNNQNEKQLNIIVRPSHQLQPHHIDPKRQTKQTLKSDKRSSSQPTVLATNADMSIINPQNATQKQYYQQSSNQSMPKHYQEEKKKLYQQHLQQKQHQMQHRKMSGEPIESRQIDQEVRTSQAHVNQNRQSGSARQQQAQLQQQNMNRQPSHVNLDHLRVVSLDHDKNSGNQNNRTKQVVSHHKRSLNKQSSVPQLNIQHSVSNNNTPYERVSEHSKSRDSKQNSSYGQKGSRKSKSSGPGRPQYSVNQPPQIPIPEPVLTDNADRRLITEDDEHEIRQVASDINEKAFFGKILRTKKAIGNENDFGKLSPRSQEIGYVMEKLQSSFRQTGQPPLTDITFYRIGKMLGRGAFGKVNLAMHKLVRKLVALKSLNKQALTDEVQKAKLMKEVNLLLKLRHNHVVKIYETIETQKHIIIVMELCAGGDLLNYVRKRRRLKEPFAQKIFKQIIDGLNYTHSKNIAHRDIKLDNILLDGKGNVKIADFGVSRQIQPDQVMREQCGTPAYIAPEILRNRGYGLNVDLWSAGVVLFAMLYGTVPFKAQTMEELHQLILKGKYLLKEDISEEARDLLRGLLEINPKKRLTVRQINRHPWLRGMDSSVQLFNDEERKMIKKEYTYNDGSRYNRNENEEPIDCFTLHHLESQYSTLKNQDSKSIILAPFNSTMSEQSVEEFTASKSKMMELMEVKQQILRFSKKCREIDRQYEFNNNGQLDNGVYHKVVANNSFEQQDKFEETQGIEVEQTLRSIKDQMKRNKSAANARNDNALTGTEQSSFLSMAEQYQIQNNQVKTLEPVKLQKLVSYGYPESYIVQSMREMQPNYCTAGYYLMEMDQNYC